METLSGETCISKDLTSPNDAYNLIFNTVMIAMLSCTMDVKKFRKFKKERDTKDLMKQSILLF